MHLMLIFLVLSLLVLTVKWTMAQPKEKLQKVWSDLAAPFTSETKDWSGPLKAWVETSLGNEKQLQAWLLALPNEGLQALGEKIAEFCTDMNVDLNWLLNPVAEVDPGAKRAAEEMIVDYCKICFKAVQSQKTSQ